MKNYINLLLLLLFYNSYGQTVNNINLLQNLISASQPGDVIELENGTYSDDFILNISQSGTADNPITIKALNPGKAIFTGSAGIVLNASYVKLVGFDFNGSSINASNEDTVILIKKGNNTIEDVRMINISNGSVSKHRYIYFRTAEAKNCIVRACWLESKGPENDGIKVYGNIPDGSTGTFNLIENCFFKSDQGVGNGSSAIRFGSGLRPQNLKGSNIIRGNLFYEYNGEDEIISLKSSYNIIEGNTFLNCHGSVTCRHYSNNTIQDNYFLNTDSSLPYGVDLRIWGEDHQILNNYFHQTKPKETDGGAISLTAGSGNLDSSLHERVNNITITDNIIYQTNKNYNALALGTNYGETDSQGNTKNIIPSNITIKGNYIYENSNKEQIGFFGGTPTVTYASNKVYQNIGITPIPNGISAIDPNLTPVSKNGYTIYSATEKGPAVDPLNINDVGPSWIVASTEPTIISIPLQQDFKNGLDTWIPVSVSGNSDWSHQIYNSNGFAEFKGNKETNEDWLLSPKINLTTTNNIQMSFDLLHRYGTNSANELQVLVSTDYNGDLASANWTQLPFVLPSPASSWEVPSSTITLDLTSYKNRQITIAFKAMANGTNNASRNWRIDSIKIIELLSLPHSQDFEAGSLGQWTSVQVAGGASKWEYRSDVNGKYARIVSNKDYGSTTENWLISPSLDMETTDDIELSFLSAFRYGTVNANEMTLWITTAFTGDVTTTQWTQLDYTLPSTADYQRYSSESIDLNPYRKAGTRIAFKATSDGSTNASRNFHIDDITIGQPQVTSCFNQTGSEPGWDRIGDVTINPVTKDVDNGDGQNDGGLEVVSLTYGTEVDQGIFYAFDCSMNLEESLEIETAVFNSKNSYVKVKIQLFNSIDNLILASTDALLIPPNSSTTITLSHITGPRDEGDQLQLRYLRADDGNPVRRFSIDWATINGVFLNREVVPPALDPECAQGANVTPDIPLSAVTAQEGTAAEQVYNTLSDTYLGSIPSGQFQKQMKQALIDYDNLNITTDAYVVNGNNTSFKEAGPIVLAFARYLKFIDSNDTDIAEKASNVVALVSQQFCRGTILLDKNAYDFKYFSRPTMYLKDHLPDSIKDQFAYVLDAQTRNFKGFWGDFQKGQGYNTDWMYNMGEQMILYGIFRYPDNDEEKVRYMKGGKRFMERFLTYSDGTEDGVKPDGTGFHHWTAYDGYMYALTAAINIIEAFNDTSFQIEEEYYLVLRNAIYAQKMFSNDTQTRALSMAGRKPFLRKVTTGKEQISKLAISGGKIMGLATADPLLAGYHNRVWGSKPAFNYVNSTPFEEGFIQFNHGHFGVYRKDNWVAVMNGFSNYMWGSELYPTNNRYGRYQSYGTLEIIYPKGTALGENGFDADTWNWNYNPGATTIVLPWDKLHGERSRIDELQHKRFVGALALKNKGKEVGALEKNYGTYGIFTMDFQEMENQGFGTTFGPNSHNASFTFKKSNFAFDDFIVCLGSGISNNDNTHSTVTTLYQRLANTQSGATVNSSFFNTGDNSFSGTQDNWVISDYNTGFYVVSGSGELKIRKGNQQTPNENQTDPSAYHNNAIDTYTLGFIDHGTNPANAAYEYVIRPNATASDMQVIARKKPYMVLEKSSDRHVVKHHESAVWGYSLFQPSTALNHENGLIKGNDAPCLVMYQELDSEHILLAITDPDLGFESRSNQPALIKNIVLTLHGAWTLDKPSSEVSQLNITDSTTTYQFTVKNAMPVEVTLLKSKKVKKVHITPHSNRQIAVGETYDFNGFATPNNAANVNLVWSSNKKSVATVDQEGVTTAVAVGKATITLKDEGTGASDSVNVVVTSKNDQNSTPSTKRKSGIVYYPNPTTYTLTVQLNKKINSYTIYDYGNQVKLSESDLNSQEIEIIVEELMEGFYILNIWDEYGKKYSEQFIKE
ncbi:DUF5017 domain-containing protein [Arenibacter sp. 6A1]|uniref:chondroitinase-B domain-containing protein n=1 Tax=Arenibacter sp. 6A1 TaxID=2720391 RepID=UPI001445CD48|nr:chondroitinase-B domain-containing protein [Arenibacter sp. 6A1]NKI26406.1 DUF5017 domain-containing protein [Arenibacter sp. 6A1]